MKTSTSAAGYREAMPAASYAVVTAPEWDASVLALLELGQSTEALATLEQALGSANSDRRFAELYGLLERFPEAALDSDCGLRLKLRLLGNLPAGPERVLAFAEGRADKSRPLLQVFLAWALAEQQDNAASLRHSDAALAHVAQLDAFGRALLWRARGTALAQLNRPGWRAAFGQALAAATGRPRLQVLLDWSAALARDGDHGGAMQALGEALHLAARDPLEIQVLNHMGWLCLQAGELTDAEEHFARMLNLTRRGQAHPLQSRALCSLALSRRALGEWTRAEQLYGQALKAAVVHGDEDDQRRALRGLGHTRRLAGRPLSALAPLEQAAQVVRADREQRQSWVYVDIAAAHVSLPRLDPGAVQEALARTGTLSPEDEGRAELVRAELARRSGNPAAALARLRALPPGGLWLREEAHAFSELFALLAQAERPLALPRQSVPLVRLEAIGCPRLSINGREVELSTSALLVLAALLEGQGRASLDTLTLVLDDDRPRSTRQAAQRVSKAVGALRAALGWDGSVQAQSRAYRLDPAAHWEYDVAEALAAGSPVRAFFSGVGLRWATDREQELSLRD